jgi:alpha-tubulin suppressor-like RCC1 family protein
MSIFLGRLVRDTSTTWTTNSSDISLNTSITGNVGVGISNPSYKLDISGNARVRGILQVGSIPNLSVQDSLDWSANGLVRYTMNKIGIGITNPTNAVEVSGNVAITSNTNNSGQVCKSGNPSVATDNDIKSIEHYGDLSCASISTNSKVYASCANVGFNDTLYHTDLGISGDVYVSDIVMSYDDPYDFSVRNVMSNDHAGFQRSDAFSYINKHGLFVANATDGTSIGAATARKTFYFPAGYETEEVDKIYTNQMRTMVITKNGYVFSLGNNSNCSSGVDGAVVASGTTLTALTRSFTRDVSGTDLSATNIRFKKAILPEGDPYTSYALTISGDLYAVGWNGSGQLADGSTTETNLKTIKCPNLVNFATGVRQRRNFIKDAIAMGSTNATNYPLSLCVLDNSGGVWFAGYGAHGQSGQGDSANSSLLKSVKTGSPLVDISNIKSIFGYGYDFYTGFMALHSTGRLYVWGNNSTNVLLNGTSTDISSAVLINSQFSNKDVSNVWLANDEDGPFLVQTTDGLVYGTGIYYGLGTGLTSGTGWRQISHFNTTTKVLQNLYTVLGVNVSTELSNFAITRDSTTGRYTLWATGDNRNGQLGVGNITYQNSWVNVGLHNDIVSQIKNIIGQGPLYTCIILNSGRLLFAGQRIPLYNDSTKYTRFTYLA